MRLKISGKRGKDGHKYNLRTTSKVAFLIVGDYNVENTNICL